MSALKKVVSRQSSAISQLLLTISLLFIANLFIFTPPALAATQGTTDFTPLNSDNFNDSVNTDRFYRNQMVTLYHTFLGTDPFGSPVYSEKVTSTMENGKVKVALVPGFASGDINKGALGMLGNTIAALYTPPASSVEYLANLGENMGLSPKTANAQVGGSGESVIHPVLALWQVIRNIAYAGFILVFVAAGLMIMFRQKLDPQTVIGIQQALPGLVIGLILVTFSYFIAAFIVDLTFVSTRLVAEIFINTGMKNTYGDDRAGIEKTYTESSAFNMFARAGTGDFMPNVTNVFGAVWSTIGPKPDPNKAKDTDPFRDIDKTKLFLPFIGPSYGFWSVINNVTRTIFKVDLGESLVAGTVASLSALLVPIILAIALMIQFIKLIIALLMSYIQILIMVIAGPLFILFSAVPGRGGVLSYWFKSLLANTLVFPAVFAGFLFAGMLLQFKFDANQVSLPLFGGLQPNIVGSLLAFGVLLGLPSIPDIVRNAFGVKGPEGFTQAAMGGFMGGLNTGRSAATGGYNQAMEKTGIRSEQQAIDKEQMEARQLRYRSGGGTTPGGLRGLFLNRRRGGPVIPPTPNNP